MTHANDKSTSRLFAEVRRAQDERLRLSGPLVNEGEHARARARLLLAIDRVDAEARNGAAAPDRRPSASWRWGLGTLAAAACAFAVLVAWPSDRALEFELDGVAMSADQVVVSQAQPRVLEVSDGSRLELAPESRLRVDEIRGNGATVELESGEVSLAVHHEDDTSWQVAAGPYAVHVTGTEFRVHWEPVSASLLVAVSEGSVRVEGPEGEIARLRAGDSLTRGRKARATTGGDSTSSEHDAIASREQAARAMPAEDQGEPVGEPDRAEAGGETEGTPSESSPRASRTWTELFDDSRYDEAWAALAAESGGIHGVSERVADAETMLDLADIARLTKHGAASRKLLERLRARFPGSDEATEAAFTLGRLAADGSSQARAIVWFETYLDEQPNGSFAGDALARLIDCHEALGHSDESAELATRYLRRFPKGPHADKAKLVLAR